LSAPQLAFVLLGFIWGSNFLFMKWAVAVITPVQVVFLRVLFGFVPILLLALFRRALRKSDFRHWPHFLAMSALATSFYYYAFVKGTSLLPSGVAGMLSGATPLFTFLAAAMFLRSESLSARKFAGVVLGFGGVALIARPWAVGRAALDLHGVAYMLAGSLGLGLSFVYARRFMAKLAIQPLALSTYQIGCSLVTLALFTPFAGMEQLTSHTKAAAGLVVGLGLTGTGLAYVLYYYLVSSMGAVRASAVTYLPPIVALVIGHTLAREPVAATDVLAVAAILCGVYLIQFPGRSRSSAVSPRN
jgi:drug/metabolite transporter (DMT)-like permease